MTRYASSLCWFRRDLRPVDHAALYAALKASSQVHCVFVFDTEILHKLPSRRDRRVEFIHGAVGELKRALEGLGGGLIVLHGPARVEVPRLAARLKAGAVIGRDYPAPVVDHDVQRRKALALYGKVRRES